MSRILRKVRINLDIQDGLRHNPEDVIVIVEARVEEARGTTKMANRESPNGGGTTIMLMAIMVDVAYLGQDIRPLDKD